MTPILSPFTLALGPRRSLTRDGVLDLGLRERPAFRVGIEVRGFSELRLRARRVALLSQHQ